jgi:hypothetical protein
MAATLAKNTSRANCKTHDETPELPRKASKSWSVLLHAPHVPKAAPDVTIPHVAVMHALNSPIRPSRSGNRIFSSASVLSANCNESGQEFDEIITTYQFEPAQNGVLDPVAALEHHLELNAPPADSPLFAYCAGVRVKPMT